MYNNLIVDFFFVQQIKGLQRVAQNGDRNGKEFKNNTGGVDEQPIPLLGWWVKQCTVASCSRGRIQLTYSNHKGRGSSPVEMPEGFPGISLVLGST